MSTLDGKVVVITGAGRGQGLEELRKVAADGGTPIAVDLALSEESREIAAFAYEGEVGDAQTWTHLAETITGEFGRLDGLVNNAGIGARQTLLEVSPEQWDRALTVNLTGPLLAIQAMVPLMTEGGSVVNVGSVAGLTGMRTTAYTVSKWGLRGLSQLAANELGDRGIRVNTVLPGYIDTPLVRQNPESFRIASLAQIPLGRVGQVTDIAPLVAFLLSDDASWISGAEIVVDGGQTSHGGTRLLVGPFTTARESQ
ncbi:SDR family NAD(P)-dependent oxidoreductase [Nocardia sp. NPDC050378]|uniref:SDR family NAD(P)-dependent oxidoreductase n=1 Tax=Nocardia sp. NPDC050378 TaxID=3155400 RepID=UPI0033E7B6F5